MEMSLRDIGLMYDEQFNRKMKIAKFLLKNLRNKKGYPHLIVSHHLFHSWQSNHEYVTTNWISLNKNTNEMQVATKWLVRVSNIKSPVLEVKKNRNAFLSYVVKVLRDGALRGCLESDLEMLCDPDNSLAFLDYPDEFTGKSAEEIFTETVNQIPLQFHSKWSQDRRTYVAVKPIPGRGALVYMAVSKVPGIKNWDLPSVKKSS